MLYIITYCSGMGNNTSLPLCARYSENIMPMVALLGGRLYASRMKTGKVIIQYGASVYPHEKRVAFLLVKTGHDVTFLPVGIDKSPDILYRGKEWEIKSPTGSKRRTLENNLRAALRQSSNIIIDLARIHIPEETCLRFLKDRKARLGKKVSIIIVRQNGKIIEL